MTTQKPQRNPTPPVEGEDFYREGQLMVLTARFHLKRGYCCGSGCRHCPYQKPDDRCQMVEVSEDELLSTKI